jgi:hypothetical protein
MLMPKPPEMAAISHYFTISRAAEILGEHEDWLHDLSIDMFSEDGCVTIYGTGEDSITAFSEEGIEYLRETILEKRSSGKAPPKGQPKAPT